VKVTPIMWMRYCVLTVDVGDSAGVANTANWPVISSAQSFQADANTVDGSESKFLRAVRATDCLHCRYFLLLHSHLLRGGKARPAKQQIHQHSCWFMVRASLLIRLLTYSP